MNGYAWSLADMKPVPPPVFGARDGETFDADRDLSRLNGQAMRVYMVMKDGQWRSLGDIAAATGDKEASISARLRDLRKPDLGDMIIDKKHVGRGLWLYQLRFK